MNGAAISAGKEMKKAAGAVEQFEYPVCPGAPPKPAWDGWADVPEEEPSKRLERGQAGELQPGSANVAMEFSENEETRLAFAAGRERGVEEGRAVERQAQAAARNNEEERSKRQLAKLIADFSAERDRFLQEVEPEVVRLALAVAARILRREAQMDPLLLMGAVRVALGQLAAGSEVTLRVPAEQLHLWTEAVALLPNLTLKPRVVSGEGMRLGDCVMESKVGTVDLGVRSQLVEIERGFFDRAGAGAMQTTQDVAGGEAEA